MMDDRAVSEIIGAVLVFAILVLLAGIVQANGIPQLNEQVEYEHAQTVQKQFHDVRSALLDAMGGEITDARVDLGTDYPSRFVFVNPGPASGSLRTGPARPIRVTGVDLEALCGAPAQPTAKSIVYQSNYNRYQNAPTIHQEGGIIYRQYDDGTVRVDASQVLVSNGTLTVVPVVGSLSRTGVSASTVTFHGVEVGYTTVNETTNVTVTVPSGLSAETWKTNERLLGAVGSDRWVRENGNGTLTINLAARDWTVRCLTVGIEQNPDRSPYTPRGTDSDEDDMDAVNPAGMGAIVLQDVSKKGSQTVDITFINTRPSAVRMTHARIPFYDEQQDSTGPTMGVLSSPDDVFRIGEDWEPVETDVTVPASGTVTVSLAFDANVAGDFFIFRVRYDGGPAVTYYVAVPGSSGGGGNGPN